MLATTRAFQTKTRTISSTAVLISDAGWGWGDSDLSLAQRAYVSARGAGVMILWSGVTPTANLGHPVLENATVEIVGNDNIQALQLIREATTDANVTITLEK